MANQVEAKLGSAVRINFPIVLEVEHSKLDVLKMFALAEYLDVYELARDPVDGEGLVKEEIIVDVLEVKPDKTTIKVTPSTPMAYMEFGKRVQVMLTQAAARFGKGDFKVDRIQFEVGKAGVASDMRGMLRGIQ